MDAITEACELKIERVEKTDTEEDDNTVDQTINVFKYEIVRLCLDTILTETAPEDEGMGLFATELTIPFKLAFNTLIKHKILIESEDE